MFVCLLLLAWAAEVLLPELLQWMFVEEWLVLQGQVFSAVEQFGLFAVVADFDQGLAATL